MGKRQNKPETTEVVEAPKTKVVRETVSDRLTPRQELFCQLYTSSTEFYGNGTEAYLEVYDIDTSKPNHRETAAACAAKLLTNNNILQRIDELLEEEGLNDQYVDKQLLHLIRQDADYFNKLGAIKEYNKLKQRITEKMHLDATVGVVNIVAYAPPVKTDSNNASTPVRAERVSTTSFASDGRGQIESGNNLAQTVGEGQDMVELHGQESV